MNKTLVVNIIGWVFAPVSMFRDWLLRDIDWWRENTAGEVTFGLLTFVQVILWLFEIIYIFYFLVVK